MKVAAIILNYHSAKDSIACATCLSLQQGVEMKLILVDNGSNTEEQKLLKEYSSSHNIQWVKAAENRGYNAGNNIGLREAYTQHCAYALIVNPDMVIKDTNYVNTLVTEMQSREDTVITCSDILTPGGIHQNPMKPEGSWIHAFDWIKGFFRKKKIDAYEYIDDYAHSHYCRKVSGCCFLIDMNFARQIGYFDEHVFLYCEEAILSKQVERLGKRMYYTTEVQAIHNHVSNQKGNASRRFAALRHSRIYYIRHYSDYPLLGKCVAMLSITIYTGLMQLLSKLCN